MTIRFDQTLCSIQARDALGKARWQASLVEASSNANVPYYHNQTHGRVCGHLLLLSAGNKILAVDALGTSTEGTRKLLWSQDLTDPSVAAAGLRQVAVGIGGNIVWGVRASPYSVAGLNPAAVATSRYVCFQRHRNLVVADPLTGDILWVRGGMAPGSMMFGDDRFLFAVAADKDEALVFRTLDGELLGKRKVPRTKTTIATPDGTQRTAFTPFNQSCLATLGRQILSWRIENGQGVLELFDPWDQRPVWPPRKFAADAKTCLVGEEAIGVFEGNGQFVLLDLQHGRTLVEKKLEPETNLSEIVVFRSGDQYVLVTSNPRPQPNVNVMPQPLPGALYKVIYTGRVYSFDLQGKMMWPAPVVIENQHLLLNQPSRLPVLTFGCGIYDRRQQGSKRHRVSVLFLDKRTGRKVFEKDFDNMTAAFELSGDPEKNTVDLRLSQGSATLTFTNDPIPPPEKQGDAGEKPQAPRPPKAANAVLRALGTALGDSLKEPRESSGKDEPEPAVEKSTPGDPTSKAKTKDP